MNDEYKKMLERFEQICQNAKKELCGEKEKEQVKEVIEQIGYQEFYRYYQEKDTLIEQQEKEIERLTELCNKYEEEHKTTFEIWQKDIKENEHLRTALNTKENIIKEVREYIEKNKDKEIPTWSGGDYDYETCLFAEDIKELLEMLDKENK